MCCRLLVLNSSRQVYACRSFRSSRDAAIEETKGATSTELVERCLTSGEMFGVKKVNSAGELLVNRAMITDDCGFKQRFETRS